MTARAVRLASWALLLGIFFMSAVLVVLINLLVDVVYVALDPRIRMG